MVCSQIVLKTFNKYISFHVSKDNLLLNAEPLVEARDSDSGSEDERHSTTKVHTWNVDYCY